ncbi:MAG: DUF2207 domain-containing protein [Parcubacteria group bacterium]
MQRSRLVKTLAVFFGVLVLTLVGLGVVRGQTQAKSWEFVRWEAAYAVQSNGDVQVRETHAIRFDGSFTFYGRTIPHRRLDDITNVRVVDESADRELSPAEYDITSTFFEGDPATDIEIRFTLADTVQTWSIYYTVVGGIGFFEEHDEFYWNVISHDRDVPIQSIEAVIQLPEEVDPGAIKTTHYQSGVGNVTEEVVNGRTIRFTAGQAEPSSDFTIVVGWPTGSVKNPGIVRVESFPSGADILVDGEDSFLETPAGLRRDKELIGVGPFALQISDFGLKSEPTEVAVQPGKTSSLKLSVFDTWPKKILAIFVVTSLALYALLPVWVALVLYLRWRKTGRDPKGRTTIIAQFEPPDQAEPAVVGTLIDEKADLKDLSASIIDLAVRGYLVIEELPKKGLSQDYKFMLKKPDFRSDAKLRAFEVQLLDKVFGSKTEVKLSELKNKFYIYIVPIQKKLYEDVVQRGYFAISPQERRSKYTSWAGILIGLGFFGLFFYGLGVPIFVSGIVVGIFGRAAPQRTRTGVLATEHARGFKLYLYTAERYVVRKMTPETFERFLPYAMVFDVEKQWAGKFKNIYTDRDPTWYHSATPGMHFSALTLTSALHGLSSATTSGFASRPGSSGHGGSFASGSSGFSGGFSGGGGGGGGSRAG